MQLLRTDDRPDAGRRDTTATTDDGGAACSRVLESGAAEASDGDLVRALLAPSPASREIDRLVGHLAEGSGGLLRLSRRSARELAAETGVSPGDALRLAAAFELGRRAIASPPTDRPLDCGAAVFERFRGLAHLERETFWAVALDARNRVLRASRVCEGSVARCVLRPADVLAPVLREGGIGLIVVHNHPSGDPEPSSHDEAFTRRLARAADLLGVRLLDHVVVAAGGFASLRERGWIETDRGLRRVIDGSRTPAS